MENVQKPVHRTNLRGLLASLGGKVFSLDFIKADGSPRTMTGRLGVGKHSKGGPNKVEATDRPYLTVYDFQHKGYRTVNLATVGRVRAHNLDASVIG